MAAFGDWLGDWLGDWFGAQEAPTIGALSADLTGQGQIGGAVTESQSGGSLWMGTYWTASYWYRGYWIGSGSRTGFTDWIIRQRRHFNR